MTFSKLLPVLCGLAVGTVGLSARAEDNPAQAAARIAIAKQLFEIGGTNTATAVAPAQPTVALHPVNSKEAKARAKAEKSAAEAKAKEDAAQAKAKAATEQPKVQAAKVETDTAQTEADKKAEANRAAQTAAIAEHMSQESTNSTIPVLEPTTKTQSKATSATERVEKEKKKAVATPTVELQPASAAAHAYAGQDLGMKPIAPPALPISASKSDRLQTLLEKYKADQITPDEYHKQRAAILAEP